VNARDFVVSIFYAIVLAIPFACDRVPDVNTPPETKPGNTARFPERIVFVSDRETSPLRQIYVMRSDGSERTRVTHDLNDYIYPAFSPDGTTILASSYTTDGSDEIYAMNVDGSNLRNLSNASGDDNFASYSPDGSRIVFTSSRDGNSEIYVMDSDGHNQARLTVSELIDHSPQFTPDGSRILFCSTKVNPLGTYSYDSDIYVMNMDGSNKICLTEELSCHFYAPQLGKAALSNQLIVKPGISSDGSRIVFTSYDLNTGINRILLMDADGSNCRVVYAGDFCVTPMFVPGDSRIIYMSHGDGKYDLYEMNLDGTNQRKLSRGTPGHVLFGQFSPDGSTILFATDVGSLSGNYKTIWTMSQDGSVQTQLTFGGGNDSFPRFQPVRK
jgi:Tol biopolymer transport system component